MSALALEDPRGVPMSYASEQGHLHVRDRAAAASVPIAVIRSRRSTRRWPGSGLRDGPHFSRRSLDHDVGTQHCSGMEGGVAQLERLAAGSDDRERLHAARHQDWVWRLGSAGAAWSACSTDYPTDVFALQAGHLADFFTLIATTCAVASHGRCRYGAAAIAGYGFLLGMCAFGSKNAATTAARGEGAARWRWSPTIAGRGTPYARHGDAGASGRRHRVDGVAPEHWAQADNGFAFHNWWHTALYTSTRATRIARSDLRRSSGPRRPRSSCRCWMRRRCCGGASAGASMSAVAGTERPAPTSRAPTASTPSTTCTR